MSVPGGAGPPAKSRWEHALLVTVVGALIAGAFALAAAVIQRGGGGAGSPAPASGGTPTAQGTTGVRPSADASSAAAAVESGDVPTSLLGRWRGDISQPGAIHQKSYFATLVVDQGNVGSVVARASYPTLKCTSTLTLTDTMSDGLALHEELDTNDDDICDDGWTMVLRTAPGGIEVRLYQPGKPPTGVPEARGILRRP